MSTEIQINLGVDFGTRFTKICAYSDEVGTAVVDFGGQGLEQALVPSLVNVDIVGEVTAACPGETTSSDSSIAQLKMALAGLGALGFGDELDFPSLNNGDVARAVSAFFLATTIERAKKWVLNVWKDHVGARSAAWSGNVGLPVEYVDSQVAPRFQEVIAVAWHWAETKLPKGNLEDLVRAYNNCEALDAPAMSYCQTYPEIAAAVMSFANSRAATPGIYVYFDIGGGTVDGVIFNLRRHQGEVHIDFYSGHVQSLGVDWIVEDVVERLLSAGQPTSDPEKIKSILMSANSDDVDAAFARYGKSVSQLVGKVVYEGKQKDRRNWRGDRIQDLGTRRTLRKCLAEEDLNPLKVFVGGGGSGSAFYQSAISMAYERNTLEFYGIPPFELIEVPAPPDLVMGSVPSSEYHRFLVAYGLSVPFGEGPEIRLPSQFERVKPAKVVSRSDLPDYDDHKAIFD
ncbi:hypothetical protein [Ruegeria arenilitoris]|uniref:hypothetical protein n=1 Tax=Ruegeria arenilitoris TaxID=1173585 RepID=UPI00147D9524|nr:hypothetical protein [Ruegeria arenilitoris]